MSIKTSEPGEFKPIGPSAHTLQTFKEFNERLLKERQKDTNPKDAVGISKAPLSNVPCGVMMELGVAMLEGALKYGSHNYRVAGVRASVYYDALMRHAMDWWEGMDLDKDSNLSHITKAIATLTVLRDAMMNDMLVDDRPVGMKHPEWLAELNVRTKALLEKYPNPKAPYLAKDATEHGS